MPNFKVSIKMYAKKIKCKRVNKRQDSPSNSACLNMSPHRADSNRIHHNKGIKQ